jgi:hypothetical protein
MDTVYLMPERASRIRSVSWDRPEKPSPARYPGRCPGSAQSPRDAGLDKTSDRFSSWTARQ